MTLDAAEVAWAAGLFEGEGCTTNTNASKNIQLRVVSTDEDVIRRIQALLGGIIFTRHPTGIARKLQWLWVLSDQESVGEAISLLWPWLCARRQEQIVEKLRARGDWIAWALRERACSGCGESFSPPAYSTTATRQTRCRPGCRRKR